MIERKTFYVIDVMFDLPDDLKDEVTSTYCVGNDTCKRVWNNGETELDDWMLENGIPINAEVLLKFYWSLVGNELLCIRHISM